MLAIRRKFFRCFALVVFCGGLVALGNGCQSEGGADSKSFHAGPFTMILPKDLKPVPVPASDTYAGAFEGPGMYLKFDYGNAANNFEDWPPSTEFEIVKIEEIDARIGTVQKGFEPGYNFSTQVSFRDTGVKPLTITAACKTLKDCQRAKKIFHSVKFKPTTLE
jgi:hypothetical protein